MVVVHDYAIALRALLKGLMGAEQPRLLRGWLLIRVSLDAPECGIRRTPALQQSSARRDFS